jgi:hypothetical protein
VVLLLIYIKNTKSNKEASSRGDDRTQTRGTKQAQPKRKGKLTVQTEKAVKNYLFVW